MSRISLVFAAALLSACAAIPDDVDSLAKPEKRVEVHGELIHEMLAQGRNFAALAHLEELRKQEGKLSPDLMLLRAEAHYRLGELDSARQDYGRLLKSDLAGQAWHGLGRLHTPSDLREALRAYNRAVQLRPTDAAIRNDLGYALLLAGRATDACRHLYTAQELRPAQGRVVANLLLCEALRGNEAVRERLLQVHGLSQAERERHQAQFVELLHTIRRRSAELQPATEEG